MIPFRTGSVINEKEPDFFLPMIAGGDGVVGGRIDEF